MANILITGATGYIGFKLAQHLSQLNHHVSALVRKNSLRKDLLKKNHVSIYEVDISYNSVYDSIKLAQPDYICHLASNSTIECNGDNLHSLINDNILFTSQLLEAMKSLQIKYLINTSTYWQYNQLGSNGAPNSFYAATKSASECLIDYYVNGGFFQAISLTLYDVFGPDDWRSKLFSTLRRSCQSNQTIQLTPGDQLLNIVHIEDVCRAYETALKSMPTNTERNDHKRYFLMNDQNLSLKEIVHLFEKTCGHKLDVSWGARNYQHLQIMQPYIGATLPNWKPLYSVIDCINQAASSGSKYHA